MVPRRRAQTTCRTDSLQTRVRPYFNWLNTYRFVSVCLEGRSWSARLKRVAVLVRFRCRWRTPPIEIWSSIIEFWRINVRSLKQYLYLTIYSEGQYHLWSETFFSLNQLVHHHMQHSVSRETDLRLVEVNLNQPQQVETFPGKAFNTIISFHSSFSRRCLSFQKWSRRRTGLRASHENPGLCFRPRPGKEQSR